RVASRTDWPGNDREAAWNQAPKLERRFGLHCQWATRPVTRRRASPSSRRSWYCPRTVSWWHSWRRVTPADRSTWTWSSVSAEGNLRVELLTPVSHRQRPFIGPDIEMAPSMPKTMLFCGRLTGRGTTGVPLPRIHSSLALPTLALVS